MEKEQKVNETASQAVVPESNADQSKQTSKKKKKKGRISRFLSNFTGFQLTMIVLGILVAAILIAVFAYMYHSAKLSYKAIPTNGLISSDEDKSWELRVVNSNQGLGAEFEVASSYITGTNDIHVDSRITKDTVKLLNDLQKATTENVDILAGYGSVEDFIKVYNKNIENLVNSGEYDEDEAVEIVDEQMRAPGTDEHSTGLLINFGIDGVIDADSFVNSESYQWLLNNAANYGYILRYPEGKEEVTLHPFDATAWRYVGVENAKTINQLGYSLEEYNAYLADLAAQEAAAQQAAEAAAAQEQAAEEAAQE